MDACFTKFALIVLACGIFANASTDTLHGMAAQDNRFNPTPDPYFNQPSEEKTKPKSNTFGTNTFPIQNQSPGSKSSHTAPNITSQQFKSPTKTKPSIWKAPLTPVRIAKNGTAIPSDSKINSIIRENPTVTNGFASDNPKGNGPPAGNDVLLTKGPNDFNPGASPVTTASIGGNDGTPSSIVPAPFTDNAALGGGKNESAKNDILNLDKQLNDVSTDIANSNETTETFEPSKVLALVGGEPIFVGDLLFEINQMIEKFMPTAPDDIKERERQKMIPRMLPKFVEQKILYLGSIRQLPPEADIEAVLEQAGKEFDDKAMKKMMESSGIKSVAEFDAHLRVQGSSLRKLRRSWSVEQLTRYFLSQQLQIETDVTHQEMLDNYRENFETYALPARSKWEQVMIRFDRSESRSDAKEKIVELGNQIVYGANLKAVAKKSSHGFRASEGGQHDWTTKGALVVKEIDDAIFSLPVGQLSEIIESRDGFHVIRVIDRTEATHKPFLEAQVEIKEKILTEKRTAAYQKHVEKLKDEIPVEYLANETAEESVDPPRTASR